MSISDTDWGAPLGLNLPGTRISVKGMIDALAQVGGSEVPSHLTYRPDRSYMTSFLDGPPHRVSPRDATGLVEAKYFRPWFSGSRILDNPTGVLEFKRGARG